MAKVLALVSRLATGPRSLKPPAAAVGSMRVAVSAPVTGSRVPWTSIAEPTLMAPKPPTTRSTITEPKPLIAPAAKELAADGVAADPPAALSPPPPPQPASRAVAVIHWNNARRDDARRREGVEVRFMKNSAWPMSRDVRPW